MFFTSSIRKSVMQVFVAIAIIPVTANLIGTGINFFKNPSIFLTLLFLTLITVDVLIIKYLFKLKDLSLSYSGVDIKNDRFYAWSEVKKIIFLSNGHVYIAFNSRKSIFTFLNYMENNFPEFYKDISAKTNTSKFKMTPHPSF